MPDKAPVKIPLEGAPGVLLDKGVFASLPPTDDFIVGDIVTVTGVPYILRESVWVEFVSGYQKQLIAGDNIAIDSSNRISADFDSSGLVTKQEFEEETQDINAKVSTNSSLISDNAASINSANEKISTLESAVSQHTSSIASNTTNLSSHITGDELRWQQIGDSNQALYAKVMADVQAMIEGRIMPYDTTNGIMIFGAAGLLDLGGGQSWSATSNGVIIVVYSAILGVAPILTINDETVSYGGISLLGSGAPSDPIPVQVGDQISASGILGLGSSFNVTFYPTKL